jgi:hypothetical protein
MEVGRGESVVAHLQQLGRQLLQADQRVPSTRKPLVSLYNYPIRKYSQMHVICSQIIVGFAGVAHGFVDFLPNCIQIVWRVCGFFRMGVPRFHRFLHTLNLPTFVGVSVL